ncbi:MAG TPA: DUF2071 domain-containing protein [Ktedonobacteraceae bacterium]|nr:DUF2071 domain-containing protein [Ktedonobacteraceae bacterium]
MLWQKNPLTMVGNLDRCWLFTYRAPVEKVRKLLPQGLEPVTHAGYAFWNIVVCHISSMRPRHIPGFPGISYWHLAYRIYVRLPLAEGRTIEGLYFLRSDCDRRLMALAGNLLTDFHFHTAPLRVQQDPEGLEIKVEVADAPAHVRLLPDVKPQYDPRSAFVSLEEAAAFLKYKPYGISLGKAGCANVVHITRDESAWRSSLVQVEFARWSFLREQDTQPEICYAVEPIRYQWDRGRIYPLRSQNFAG